MVLNEYKINPDFSGTLIEINGKHGTVRCKREDRIYFIIEGEGKFIIEGKETGVGKNDLVFIPKGTAYDIIGRMKYFLIHSPEFKPGHDEHI
jgi:mannose-6-phosphate isomerase-like protein (cupin superfamily)